MSDPQLQAHVERIKRLKPSAPGPENCIDFSLGDSGHGVRIVLCYEEGAWNMSTSIGLTAVKGMYTPMLLRSWTRPLRESATAIADEVLECFNVDEDTKSVGQGRTVVLFRFEERK